MFALSNVGAEIQMFLIDCNWTWRGFGLLYTSCRNTQPTSAWSSEGLCFISPLLGGWEGSWGRRKIIPQRRGPPLSRSLAKMPFSLRWGAPFSGADCAVLFSNFSSYLKGKVLLPGPLPREDWVKVPFVFMLLHNASKMCCLQKRINKEGPSLKLWAPSAHWPPRTHTWSPPLQRPSSWKSPHAVLHTYWV